MWRAALTPATYCSIYSVFTFYGLNSLVTNEVSVRNKPEEDPGCGCCGSGRTTFICSFIPEGSTPSLYCRWPTAVHKRGRCLHRCWTLTAPSRLREAQRSQHLASSTDPELLRVISSKLQSDAAKNRKSGWVSLCDTTSLLIPAPLSQSGCFLLWDSVSPSILHVFIFQVKHQQTCFSGVKTNIIVI